MTLRLYNSLTRQAENFISLEPKMASLYVCGVTVYDDCHVGHARAYVSFDILRRVLEHNGFTVKHIQNFTDIDDKIIARSQKDNEPWKVLTERYIAAFKEDMAKLNILPATRYPKATDAIPGMIQLIQKLLDKGFAYAVDRSEAKEILFSVEKMPDYGKLSHKVLEDLVSGIRVEIGSLKRNPLDFVLWKPSKPGEPSWDSPWGPGRPGWHIECSAMAMTELGETIDIHAGGEDLIFPHHENEIAQSESATGKPFARYWLHNGFITIRGDKMSKSQKNFFTIRDVLKKFDGETLRFFLMRVHYRSPLAFSEEGLNEAETALQRLYTTLKNIPNIPFSPDIAEEADALEIRFNAALADDLNVSEALGVLFDLNKLCNKVGAGTARLRALGNILGLFGRSLETEIFPIEVEKLAQERKDAKTAKNYALADELRKKILDLGYIVEDSKDGFRLKKA